MRGIGVKLLCMAAVAASAVAAGGCAADPATPADAATVNVVERDYRITAPERIDAGDVRLAIRNRGPDSHEFVLLRANGSMLPMRADGMTVDEDAVEARTVAVVEPQPPGVHELDVELTPGRYVMICNMSGHLLGGMRRDLVVQ